ncbi:unnamed protein product [Cuscuta epithymum]|uniref:Uncharacterized protein n=1 Tax=Cuscuta epithymum TaxID=186058 RepID=A0AAV0DT01_9ASTE|nr:unnamed protein product [Cuscuta epithymum]
MHDGGPLGNRELHILLGPRHLSCLARDFGGGVFLDDDDGGVFLLGGPLPLFLPLGEHRALPGSLLPQLLSPRDFGVGAGNSILGGSLTLRDLSDPILLEKLVDGFLNARLLLFRRLFS